MIAAGAPILALADLEIFDPQAPPRNGRRRFACPLPSCAGHPRDAAHRALTADTLTGLWRCHRCGTGGKLREFWPERPATPWRRLDPRGRARLARARLSLAPPPSPRQPEPCDPCRPDLAELVAGWQAALPGSPGAAYLAGRGIPLELAQAHGIGYATSTTWPGRDGGARVVIPHTRPDGLTVNAYGRAIAPDVPRHLAHDHLPGRRGLFNAPALADSADPVHITEAPIDALAMMAAGYGPAVALFGTAGLPWDELPPGRALVLALDADGPGQRAAAELLAQAGRRGHRVGTLPPGAYGGHKDAAAAGAAGCLAPPPSAPSVAASNPGRVPTLASPLSGRVGPHSGADSGPEPDIGDPRPDLAEDAALWRRLLDLAAGVEADLLGAILGARCAGAQLIEDGRGLRLQPRPGTEADYAAVRAHLAPHSAAVTALLRGTA